MTRHSIAIYSYMTHSAAWDTANRLPFQRGGAPEPGVNGYLSDDRTYSSGGRALNRASVRSYR